VSSRLTLWCRIASTTSTRALLGQQHSANALVNWLQRRQVGRRNLDGIASHRQNDNVFPRMKFVLVLDHLGTLPIILDAGSLERELLHLNRDWATGLCFNNGNVIFGLGTVHIHHPGLGNDSSNNDILWFPVLGTVGSIGIASIVLDHVFSFSNDHVRVGYIEQKWQRSGSFLDESGSILGVFDINTINLEKYVSQFHTRRSSGRTFHDEGHDGAITQSIDN